MKSLVKVKKVFGVTVMFLGELTFIFGMLVHGSTLGRLCEFVGMVVIKFPQIRFIFIFVMVK